MKELYTFLYFSSFWVFSCYSFYWFNSVQVRQSLYQYSSALGKEHGIKRTVLKNGNNIQRPSKGDTVSILWKLFRSDGSLAHTIEDYKNPFEFIVESNPSEVIKGWDIIIKEMTIGEKIKVTIPSNLAFGETGYRS
jgi:FKBP-type peptidyl-prolyl cis-trans isomerase